MRGALILPSNVSLVLIRWPRCHLYLRSWSLDVFFSNVVFVSIWFYFVVKKEFISSKLYLNILQISLGIPVWSLHVLLATVWSSTLQMCGGIHVIYTSSYLCEPSAPTHTEYAEKAWVLLRLIDTFSYSQHAANVAWWKYRWVWGGWGLWLSDS